MVTTQRQPKQLGQILLEQGLISEEQLQRALNEHRNTPKSLGRVLIDLGYIREWELVRALAEQVGPEFVDLTEYRVDAAATALLPEALCRRYRALPIGEEDGKLSSLHTNDAPSAITRLIEVETFLVGSAIGGMYTLRDDGLHKAASGITSIEEIARVVK
jgi:MshEN domain